MIYPIHIIGSPVLRKVAKDISPDYPNLEKIIENLKATMYDSDGVGLAAPQVGKSIRIFVIDASPLAEDEPELENFKKIFINAHITERTGNEYAFNEGCLSIPGIREDVNRPEKIRMKYVDENFEEHEEEFDGLAARVIQHEYDHLDGKLFTDHLSPLRKRIIKSKLAGISKGKFTAKYAVHLAKG